MKILEMICLLYQKKREVDLIIKMINQWMNIDDISHYSRGVAGYTYKWSSFLNLLFIFLGLSTSYLIFVVLPGISDICCSTKGFRVLFSFILSLLLPTFFSIFDNNTNFFTTTTNATSNTTTTTKTTAKTAQITFVSEDPLLFDVEAVAVSVPWDETAHILA